MTPPPWKADRAGEEVVQFYVQHPNSDVARPVKELKGFERISLQPGETQTVQFPLHTDALRYWNADADTWVLENETIRLQVGASSANIRLEETVEVAR